MARKRTEEEPDNHERWLVSYADFITLLFAFFIVLYATSNQDIEKQKKFEESVRKAFVAVAQFGSNSGTGEFENIDENASPIPPPIEVFKRNSGSAAQLMDAVEQIIEKSLTKEEKEKVQFDLREDPFGVRISLDSAAMFDSGSTAMKKDTLAIFDKIAAMIKQTQKHLVVEGHTDNQPINTSTYPSNWELAAARASTIVRYMIKVNGIAPSKLAAVSLADQRPVASNDTEAGRKKNRRIEILLTTKTTSLN